MAKRSRLETAFETRLRERARQREESKHFFAGEPRNRTERRLLGETTASRAVPQFKTVEQADRWMEKQERIQAHQRSLMTEPAKTWKAQGGDGMWHTYAISGDHRYFIDGVEQEPLL